MDEVGEFLSRQQRCLQEATDHELFSSKLMDPIDVNQRRDTVPVDAQILTAFEELRRLKAQLAALRTKKLFVSQILAAKSLKDHTPSENAGNADMALRGAKQELRSIKAGRAACERRLVNAVMEHCGAEKSQKQAADAAHSRLHGALSNVRGKEVKSVLESRDLVAAEALVEHIDEVNATGCRDLITMLREEKDTANRDAAKSSSRVENLRSRVEELQHSVQENEHLIPELKEKIATLTNRDPQAVSLKLEEVLLEQLQNAYPLLTGIGLSEFGESSMSLEINAASLAPEDLDLRRSGYTHILKMEMCKRPGMGDKVENAVLDPPTAHVSDVEDTPLPWALRFVGFELAASTRQQTLEAKES